MPFNPKAIANFFLELAKADGSTITPMQIQKLVFYAHGWWLGLKNEPLINEQVECWRYGPVIPSLFHAFKEHGSGPITTPAVSEKFAQNETGIGGFFNIEYFAPTLPDDATEVKVFLKSIWNALKGYSATKLSNMSHVAGGPWSRTVSDYNGIIPKGTDIPSQYIREYFTELARTSKGTS